MIIPWIGRATANFVLFRSTTSCFQSTPYTTKVHCSFGQRRQNPFGEIAIAYLGHNCSIFFSLLFWNFWHKEPLMNPAAILTDQLTAMLLWVGYIYTLGMYTASALS